MRYSTRRRKSASERGKRMAQRRWELDRIRRDRLAALDPIKFEGHILRRIVVIDNEKTVREAVIYDFDGYRSAKRKINGVLNRK